MSDDTAKMTKPKKAKAKVYKTIASKAAKRPPMTSDAKELHAQKDKEKERGNKVTDYFPSMNTDVMVSKATPDQDQNQAHEQDLDWETENESLRDAQTERQSYGKQGNLGGEVLSS